MSDTLRATLLRALDGFAPNFRIVGNHTCTEFRAALAAPHEIPPRAAYRIEDGVDALFARIAALEAERDALRAELAATLGAPVEVLRAEVTARGTQPEHPGGTP